MTTLEEKQSIPGAPLFQGTYQWNIDTKKTNLKWPFITWFKTYDSSSLRRGYKVMMKSQLASPLIVEGRESIFLNKVFTKEELFQIKNQCKTYNDDYRRKWKERLKSLELTQCFLHKSKINKLDEQSQILVAPGYFKQKEFNNRLYGFLTGYSNYVLPQRYQKQIPQGYYFNPYANGMITKVPPILYDGMVEFEDGTPASVPQMAHDLVEFISFLHYGRAPDLKLQLISIGACTLMMLPLIYLFRKYQYVNKLSYRLEIYSVKGGYKRFQERTFKMLNQNPKFKL